MFKVPYDWDLGRIFFQKGDFFSSSYYDACVISSWASLKRNLLSDASNFSNRKESSNLNLYLAPSANPHCEAGDWAYFVITSTVQNKCHDEGRMFTTLPPQYITLHYRDDNETKAQEIKTWKFCYWNTMITVIVVKNTALAYLIYSKCIINLVWYNK